MGRGSLNIENFNFIKSGLIALGKGIDDRNEEIADHEGQEDIPSIRQKRFRRREFGSGMLARSAMQEPALGFESRMNRSVERIRQDLREKSENVLEIVDVECENDEESLAVGFHDGFA